MAVDTGNKFALSNTTIAATATLVAPEDPARRGVHVQNIEASATIYFGASGVTSSDYYFSLAAGQRVSDSQTRDALYAITASGTASIRGFIVR